MRRLLLLAALASGLGVAGALARPPFLGGVGAPAAGSTSACDPGGSGVCAQYQNGQTFVRWPDVVAASNSYRYRVYRSTSPITAGNYGSATEIASYDLNNSAQLFGGDPNSTSTAPFTQTYRQDNTRPMVPLTVAGHTLTYGDGLQAYTVQAPGSAYYAVVSTDTSDASPAFIGSVGPIAESVATPQPLKVADSTRQTIGKIDQPITNVPVAFTAHASNAAGGCSVQSCQYGDYWTFFLPPGGGAMWKDGRQTTLDVYLDHLNNYRQNTLIISNRDTVWDSLGNVGMETIHSGLGFTPNPLIGPANRMYLSTADGIAEMLRWAIANYSLDANQLHWVGVSMGAWGGANTGMRMTNPEFSAIWLALPMWRLDKDRGSGSWPGAWTSGMPFKATVGTAPSTLGTVASSVLLPDGTVWGGDGDYADTANFIASNPGTDLPVMVWMASKDDNYATWPNTFPALAAFKSAHRGYAFAWFMGIHDTAYPARGAVDCDWPSHDDGVCYHKSDFKLNAPYPAFENSSIDDNPGTATRGGNGLYDGNYAGCINCGFKWSFLSDTGSALHFTVSNAWMTRSPTSFHTTTLAGSMAASGSGTVAATDTSGFLSVSSFNNYLLIGNEVVSVTSVAGNTISFSSRGLMGTTAQSHSAGETVTQLTSQPTGPNGGPYSTMTVDVTPRRLQGFIKSNGTVVSCTITPFGAGSSVQTPTVASGIWTLTGVTINSGGSTDISCAVGG